MSCYEEGNSAYQCLRPLLYPKNTSLYLKGFLHDATGYLHNIYRILLMFTFLQSTIVLLASVSTEAF